MDLETFMDSNGSRSQGTDLTQLGPFSQLIYQRLKNEDKTRSTVASVFWRTFLASDALPRVLQLAGASSNALISARFLVAPQSHRDRFDLLILDPGLAPGTPAIGVEVNRQLFRPMDIFKGASIAATRGTPAAVAANFVDLAIEAGHAMNGQAIVIAPAPLTERLSVVSPHVDVDDGGGTFSTAGVRVQCRSTGAFGVTAALHGVIGASGSVLVGGGSAVISKTHAITDSAFLEMVTPPTQVYYPKNGLMSGMLPRGQQKADFDGRTSGPFTTTITGFDPQLPNPSKYRQGLIYTGRDAQTGDSGASLVTDDGYLVGFAFERTRPGQSPEHCSWIWADSVLNALNLDLA